MASGLSVGLAIGLGGIFAVAARRRRRLDRPEDRGLATAAGPALGAVLALGFRGAPARGW